jgi:UDP-N-acetylenolpyruvoylglucosamine reductase
MSNNINYRLERHPKEFSAGSVFKNLLADEILQKNKDLYLELEKQGLIRGEKIGVAYLIEKAGLKGKSIGGAQVSNKHANFIVNNNSATANDIKELIAFVKKEFFNKYNLVLEEELQYLGF